MDIKRVGILGAGTMGGGITQVIIQAGFQVVLLDLSETLVKEGFKKIDKNLSKSVEKGKLSSQEKENICQRISPTTNIENLKDSELIIEAVFEDLKLKVNLFKELSTLCPTDTVFASNTSTLSITQMAAEVSQTKRFLGLHFFNPVPAMKLVEVISGLQTSSETVKTGLDFVKRVKKIPIEVKDCPGFLVNRILLPFVGEAMLVAQEGAASPQEIDESVKRIGFPMGPLALNDLVGIDIGDHTFPVMYDAYGERFPVPLLFGKLLKIGRLGMKSGKGIYADGKIDEEFTEIVRRIQNETGIRNTEFSADRLILRQVNEAVHCLQEKIATAEDIDRAMVLATGFPSDEKGVGGPLHWADDKGLDWVLNRLNYFKDSLGTRFLPHFLLKQHVAAGYLGKKVEKVVFEY